MDSAFTALLALGLDDTAKRFWPLILMLIAFSGLLNTKKIAAQPFARHVGEFVGDKTVLAGIAGFFIVWICVFVWFTYSLFFRTFADPFMTVVYRIGFSDGRIVSALPKMMTPQVMDVHNKHARAYNEARGAMAFDSMLIGAMDEVRSLEEAGTIPSGSYHSDLGQMQACMIGEYYLGATLAGDWRSDIREWMSNDTHDYRQGPNPNRGSGSASAAFLAGLVVTPAPTPSPTPTDAQPTPISTPAVAVPTPTDVSVVMTPVPSVAATPTTGPVDMTRWDQVRTAVMPMLARTSSLSEPREGVNISTEGLIKNIDAEFCRYYAVWDGTRVVPVTRTQFVGYGITEPEFTQAANANLEAFFTRSLTPQVFDQPEGARVLSFTPEVPFAASFLLLPQFSRIVDTHLDGPFIVFYPTEKTLVCVELGRNNRQLGDNPTFASTFLDKLDVSAQGAIDSAPGLTLSHQAMLVWDGGMTRYVHNTSGLPDGVVQVAAE